MSGLKLVARPKFKWVNRDFNVALKSSTDYQIIKKLAILNPIFFFKVTDYSDSKFNFLTCFQEIVHDVIPI